MKRMGTRTRLQQCLLDIYRASTELKALQYEPDAGMGMADAAEVKDAEDRLDEIALCLKTLVMNLEPVKTAKIPPWLAKDR